MTSKDDDDNLLDDSDDDRDLVKISTTQSLTRLVSSRKKVQKCTVSETISGAQTPEPSSACFATSPEGQRYKKLEIGRSRLSRNKDKAASIELSKCTLKSVSQPISVIQMEREEILRNSYCQGEDDNILDDSDDDKIVLDKRACQFEKGAVSSATRNNNHNENDQRRERYDTAQTNQHITDVDIQRKTCRRKSDGPVSLDNIIDSDSSESNYDDLDFSENDGNESSTTRGSEGEGEEEEEGDDAGDCSSAQIQNASNDNDESVDCSRRNCSRSYAAQSSSSSSCTASDSTESASLLLFGPAVSLALEEDDVQHFLYILVNHTTWTDNIGGSSSNTGSKSNSNSGSNCSSNSNSNSGSKKYEDTSSFEQHNVLYPPSGIQVQGPDTSCASAASSHTILTAQGSFLAFLKRSYQVHTVFSPSEDTVTGDLFDLLLFAVEQGAFQCSKLILDIYSHCHSSSSSSNCSNSSSSSSRSSNRDTCSLSPKYTPTPGRPQLLPPTTISTESCSYSECLHRAVQECGVLYSVNDLLPTQQPQPQELQAKEDNILKGQNHNKLNFNPCDADCSVVLSPPLSIPPPPLSTTSCLTPSTLPLPVLLLSGSKFKHEIDSIITINSMISDEIYIRCDKERKREVRNSMKKLPRTASASLFAYALASDSSDILHYICDAFPFYVYGELRGSGIAKNGGGEGM